MLQQSIVVLSVCTVYRSALQTASGFNQQHNRNEMKRKAQRIGLSVFTLRTAIICACTSISLVRGFVQSLDCSVRSLHHHPQTEFVAGGARVIQFPSKMRRSRPPEVTPRAGAGVGLRMMNVADKKGKSPYKVIANNK